MKEENFDEQKEKAMYCFHVFKHQIEKHLGEGKIYFAEKSQDEIHKQLDMKAGIDAYFIGTNGVQSLALRAMEDKVHNKHSRYLEHFTIRTREKGEYNYLLTEYWKKKNVFEHPEYNLIYPTITIQIYVDNMELPKSITNGAIIPTIHLFNHVLHSEFYLDKEETIQVRKSEEYYLANAEKIEGNNSMISVPFSRLENYITRIDPAFNGEINEK